MTTYSIQLVGDTLKVDFVKTDEDKPILVDGDCLVQEVQLLARQAINSGEIPGGNLLKIQGRIPVVACYTLCHEVAHLYRAVAVLDTRLASYVVVSSTAPEYPFSSRIDFHSGEVTQVAEIYDAGTRGHGDAESQDAEKMNVLPLKTTWYKSPSELAVPSFVIRREGDILRVQINNAVQVDGDQIIRDAKAQLQGLIDSGQLSGGKQLLKINGRSTVLASFVIASALARSYRAIAVFEPKLDCYIVTISHTQDYCVGDTINPKRDGYQTVKVVLCGFPNTGKTVFRDGLREAIFRRKDAPDDFYTISGCPDGDGCWFSETVQKYPDLAKQLKTEYKARFTPEFAAAKARDIRVNKNSLLLFDVGGKISPENELIMSQATHAVILAKSEEEVAEWQNFCQKLNLPVIAIIYSVLEATVDEIWTESPQLTGKVHRLQRGELVMNRPLIQALAKRLVELVRVSGVGYQVSGFRW
ncbi:MAG: hypothetical protein F6K31_03565 [Symploca sp. SIO2G7]|nr:hypothetical protein [Symploca sp. SIO2G7]